MQCSGRIAHRLASILRGPHGQADRAFQSNGRRNSGPDEAHQRQASLEAALTRKDELLSELLQQFVRLAQQSQQP
jgi:hypothetical protein